MDADWCHLELDFDNLLTRFVNTTDWGLTHLAATIRKESFDKKLTRNDDHAKLLKNQNTVFQPCATDYRHKRTYQQTQELSRTPVLTPSVGPKFDKAYYKLHDEDKANLPSWKVHELQDAVDQASNVY